MGRELYVSPNDAMQDPLNVTIRQLGDGEGFTIPPGQFAFLLTEEKIEVPNNALALISIKAKIKWRGLINVSGFHVDPGFRGRLIFSVYDGSFSRYITPALSRYIFARDSRCSSSGLRTSTSPRRSPETNRSKNPFRPI